MGLAASQARLLLLTSRRSDLEYRAQMISQHKIALAMETEQIAVAYTEALNNKQMMFTYKTDLEKGTNEKEVLTYDSIMFGTDFQNYRLVDRDGNVVCFQEKDLGNRLQEGENFKIYSELKDQAWLQEALKCGFLEIQIPVECGRKPSQYVKTDAEGNQTTITVEEYQNLVEKNDGSHEGYNEVKGDIVYEWESQILSGMSEVTEELYTKDDNAAMATYERKSREVQTKDKQLDVELKQVETQLEACKSEQESVKKLIQDHAQNDFKSFA